MGIDKDMELKDVILSTLAEMEEEPLTKTIQQELKVQKPKQVQQIKTVVEKEVEKKDEEVEVSYDEISYLKSLRERFLVLFEGFQAPNNTSIEAKVDLTLNFLEYVLATIETRIETIEKGNK